MKSNRMQVIAGAVVLTISAFGAVGSAQAQVYTEDFEGAFPAWESGWFGTLSNARNVYCDGALGCTNRGNNPDGLWIISTDGQSAPVTVSFDTAFGASLTSFKLDVAAVSNYTLSALDKDGVEIFSQQIEPTFGYDTDPGVYASYTINSANGIRSFAFSDGAAGNTSIDNLVATSAVPEPTSMALMLAGLVGLAGLTARARRRQV